MTNFGPLIKANQARMRGSAPYRPEDYPSMPGSQPPHVWKKGNGLPLCKFCFVSSLQAQLNNPETRGEGPCPKRPSSATPTR